MKAFFSIYLVYILKFDLRSLNTVLVKLTKSFRYLQFFSEYVVHATGHALQHKKINSNALFVNQEVLKSFKFYPKILT